MDVYELLTLACDLSECKVSIWDLASEKTVWESDDDTGFDIASEVDWAGFGRYEVASYEIYLNKNNKLCFEINIEIEEEEE